VLLDELGPRAWWLLLVGLLSAAAVAVGIERSAVPVLARPAGWTGRVGGRGRRSEATLSSADSRHIRAAAEVEASVASGPSLPPDCGVPKSVPKSVPKHVCKFAKRPGRSGPASLMRYACVCFHDLSIS
jgi:hypothetical protein